MAPPSRPVIYYPLCLLVGSLLAVAAGIAHPDLTGDGPTQLATIAQCGQWRAIHWGFLEIFFASVLALLVAAVGAFALFVALQLFRNPARPPR